MSYGAYSILRDHPSVLAAFVATTLALVALPALTKRMKHARGTAQVKRPAPQVVRRKAPFERPEDTETPWVSELLSSGDNICEYDAVVSPQDDPKKRRISSARNLMGFALGPEMFYQQTRAMKSPPDRLTDLAVIGQRFLLVSPSLQALLEGFDMGQGNFYGTEFLAADGVTPLPHRHKYWNIGNQKEALEAGDSQGLHPLTKDPASSAFGVFSKPMMISDGMICVSRSCLGGADVWADPKLRSVLFFGDALVRKLQEQGFADAFDFSRCKMIDKV